MKCLRAVTALVLCPSLIAGVPPSAGGQTAPAAAASDVLLTTPFIRPYERIFSFLDANLQDMAAIQASVTAIDPNGSNSTSIDALQQSFQANVSFNKLNGILDASQAQYYAANVAAQTSLLAQQSTLITQLQTAQQALTAAQTAGGQNPTADQQTAITSATTNYQTILGQVSTLKSLLALSPPQGLTATSASSITGPSTGLASNTNVQQPKQDSPSFPASKKLDNIQQFYWDRLTRLINTLSLPDNFINARMYFVSFNPSVMRTYKKANLLETRYALSCTDSAGKPTPGVGVPAVLDLYPRQAAVNIASEKWRDRSFGLSAALSWFTLGAAASYNQEHLKASQSMAQSSYVSGYGIGGSTFGWLFGKSLGDDSIGVGDKPTEALIAVPEGCKSWTVAPTAVSWIGNDQKALSHAAISAGQLANGTLTQAVPPAKPGDDQHNHVVSLEYSTAVYDSSAGSAALATVVFEIRDPLDPEATVSVDGVLLKRARDSFGRATASGGTGGMLETANLGANTWTPIGPRRILLELDVAPYAYHFPRVDLNSPLGAYNLQNQMMGAGVTVDGKTLSCQQEGQKPADVDCLNFPPPGRPKGAGKNLTVYLRKWDSGSKDVSLLLSSPDDVPPAAANTASGSAVQVITENKTQFWGAQTVVTATPAGDPTTEITFQCEPVYGRLECRSPQYDPAKQYALTAIDGMHQGAAIVGNAQTPKVEDANNPPILMWGLTQPFYNAKANNWTFRVTLANVADKDPLQLTNSKGATVLRSEAKCGKPWEPCAAIFTISAGDYDSMEDTMSLAGSHKFAGNATVLNLKASISPLIGTIDVAGKNFWGNNLAFDQMQIGAGSLIRLSCVVVGDRKQCDIPAIPAKAKGFLYFVTPGGSPVPWYQSTPSGLTALKVDALAPPKPAAPPGGVGGVKASDLRESIVPGPLGWSAFNAAAPPAGSVAAQTRAITPNSVYAVQ